MSIDKLNIEAINYLVFIALVGIGSTDTNRGRLDAVVKAAIEFIGDIDKLLTKLGLLKLANLSMGY
ncbi:MAG: hypothetical protein AB1489_04245 [Acidobacteriota bacterium]